jgi:dihydroflavonol-4-reductase
MRAFVTGATGFIGSSVVRVLLEAGCEVRALVRPGADERAIAGLPIERVPGDIRDPASLRSALRGCAQLYHVAALYVYWTRNPAEIYATNVEGTRNVLAAAEAAGVDRVVHTSSVATLGLPGDGRPGNENTPSTLDDMVSDYKRSKFMAEEVAREFAARGLPVVIVNPSTPVGVRDVKPTPTGRIVLDFINGRMPVYVDTGLNMVDVEDVALGHWLAAQKGQIGQRYILGGRNMTMKEILETLGELSGRPAPKIRVPLWVAMLYAYSDVARARVWSSYVPRGTPDMVRLAYKHMYFDPSRAVSELGLPQNDPRDALRKAVKWFQGDYNRGGA